jgi:pyrimidine-nucleoside phosphorylase
MIALGTARGCPTVALITAMDRPLGVACGNALEVVESIMGLRGEGPADLMEVTFALGIEMLLLAGLDADAASARKRLETTIADGSALDRFRQMVAAQGGDPNVVDHPERLPTAPIRTYLEAGRDGVVTQVEPRALGRVIIELGGGRRQVTDAVLPDVGLELLVKPGQRLNRGDPLAVVHARSREALDAVTPAILAAIPIGDAAPEILPLVAWRVTSAGATPYGAS